ncbi:hypothetical protein IPM65_07115 [Candidatus Roizmanbacteria bacterium]|nr:MAG: hypothetical protein IPM65_07115 [Candidatus Roizmanbacteria bacterium]
MLEQELLIQTTETISENKTKKTLNSSAIGSVHTTPFKAFDNALNNIFSQSDEVNKIARTRRLLGETADHLTEEQLKTIVTDFQFLIDTWLDAYEKELFDGVTLQNLLKGT